MVSLPDGWPVVIEVIFDSCPVVHDVLCESARGAGELGRPDPGHHQPLALIVIRSALIESVLAVIDPGGIAESEDGIGAAALPVVDGMRPGVGNQPLESV